MRAFLIALIFVFLLGIPTSAQEGAAIQPERRRFEIRSFLADDRQVATFQVYFLLDGRIIPAERDGSVIYVPTEVYTASWERTGIRFLADKLYFEFNNLGFKGYLHSDDIKFDYVVQVDTLPCKIRTSHVSRLNKSEMRSLGIRSYKEVCAVYSIASTNVLVKTPDLIVDPITVRKFKLCK